MERKKLGTYVGGALIVLGVIFGLVVTYSTSSASDASSQVQIAKSNFFVISEQLCMAKLEEYKEMIVNDDDQVTAMVAGSEIDRLGSKEGCNSFLSDVLLSATVDTGK